MTNISETRPVCEFPSSEKRVCNWSNKFRNLSHHVLVRSSLCVQLNQSSLLISPNHQGCHKHRQFSPLSGQKILDSGRNFLISYTFHKSVSLQIFQHITQGLRAYAWKLLSQMVEPQRSLVSKLSQGTQYPFLPDDINEPLARAGTNATGFSFLPSNHSVT